MALQEIQREVDKWVSQYKVGYFDPKDIMLRLMEETGELAREVNHMYGPKQKKLEEAKKDLGAEVGDILFTIVCLANREEIDLDESWKKVMDKCYGRDAGRYEKKP